jgi:hypothetical protein
MKLLFHKEPFSQKLCFLLRDKQLFTKPLNYKTKEFIFKKQSKLINSVKEMFMDKNFI